MLGQGAVTVPQLVHLHSMFVRFTLHSIRVSEIVILTVANIQPYPRIHVDNSRAWKEWSWGTRHRQQNHQHHISEARYKSRFRVSDQRVNVELTMVNEKIFTLYWSRTLLFKKSNISSNLSSSSFSSFFLSKPMLKPKMASIPLARQWSKILNTISKGKLQGPLGDKGEKKCESVPITKQCQKPLRAEHTWFDTLPEEMYVKHRNQLLNQAIKL